MLQKKMYKLKSGHNLTNTNILSEKIEVYVKILRNKILRRNRPVIQEC